MAPRFLSQPVVDTPVERVAIVSPASQSPAMSGLALSADGRALVYTGRTAEGTALYLRSLDQSEPRLLPGTESGYNPAFSPDGKSILFDAGSAILKKIVIATGEVTAWPALTPASPGHTWLPDGTIIAGRIATGLFRIADGTGSPVALTSADAAHEVDHHSPSWLPGDKALLFTIHRGSRAYDIGILRLDSKDRRVLIQDAFDAKYLRSGHIVFARGDTLYAARFDRETLELAGPALPIVEGVATEPDNGQAFYAVSDEGTLAYLPVQSRQGRRLIWVDRKGATEPLQPGPRAYRAPSLSPDGSKLAVEIEEGGRTDIWINTLGTDALTRLTFDGMSEAPIWTPDGREITYASTKPGERRILLQTVQTSGRPTAIPGELSNAESELIWPASWGPNRSMLAFTVEPPTGRSRVGLLTLRNQGLAVLDDSEKHEFTAKWVPRMSPDGKWLAYSAYVVPSAEVFLALISGGAGRQISANGGTAPIWSRDGRELFYRQLGQFFVASVAPSTGVVGRPMELPIRERTVDPTDGNAGYDVSIDGKRLLVVRQDPEESAPRQIQIVLNWFTELNRKVSAK
jgi:serine/threonine-protein kinase